MECDCCTALCWGPAWKECSLWFCYNIVIMMNITVSLIGLHMGCFTLHNVEGMRVERSWALAKFIVASFSWPQTHFSYLCAFEISSLKITAKKLQPSPSLYFKKTKKSRWARERSCLSKQSWQVFTEEIIEFSSIPGCHPCQGSQLLSVLSWTALRHSVNQWETKHLLRIYLIFTF